jgi:hypothetical protein
LSRIMAICSAMYSVLVRPFGASMLITPCS